VKRGGGDCDVVDDSERLHLRSHYVLHGQGDQECTCGLPYPRDP
jgi:hypothetical protein